MIEAGCSATIQLAVPLARVARQRVGHGLRLIGGESELGGQHGR